VANTLLTIGGITREAIRLFMNSNAFIGNIEKQYDSQFAKTGAKIGQQLKIRLPNDFTVADGPSLQVQDTNEQSTTITVATQRHVDTSFNSVDMTMSLDDYSEIILAPKINVLAGNVAATIMTGVTIAQGAFSGTVVNGAEGGICNYVSNTDVSGNIISPTSETWLTAGAKLDSNSAQVSDRKIITSPFTMARTVSSLSGLFNPATEISRQYRNAKMYDALNFEWFMDQTTVNHTGGTYNGAATISGGTQTGASVTITGGSGTLAKGDIITLAGCNRVNRVTKQDTGELQQFVVTAAMASGGTSISIYPSIVPPVSGQAAQYQTVTASPTANGAVLLVNPASATYRMNFAYARQAVTMVTADLEIPPNVKAAREQMDGVSMRAVTQYVIGTDQTADRLDILFGWLFVRPEWACIVPDKI